MALETFPFDPAEYLTTAESQAELLADAFETGNVTYIAHALGVIARARGMTETAKQAGVTREGLYKALRKTGDPRLSTLLGVTEALGYRLSVVPLVPKTGDGRSVSVRRLRGSIPRRADQRCPRQMRRAFGAAAADGADDRLDRVGRAVVRLVALGHDHARAGAGVLAHHKVEAVREGREQADGHDDADAQNHMGQAARSVVAIAVRHDAPH